MEPNAGPFLGHQDHIDDQPVNPRQESSQVPRRTLLKGGLAGCVSVALLSQLGGCCKNGGSDAQLLGFKSVPVQTAEDFDQVLVADGYSAQPFFSWGEPVVPGAPAWKQDASQNWQDQLLQAGDNHDGMHFFPLEDDPQNHGLLVVNHEYVNDTLHPNGKTVLDGKRPLAEVLKEQAAHGLSIIEIQRDSEGQWQKVANSHYNRRLTGLTPMALSGPVAGTDALQTQSDSTGKRVLGTLNNCAMGYTPWGTYLICEENWHKYFYNSDEKDYQTRPSHKRYGIPHAAEKSNYGWHTADPRFNASPGGYVNEPNRFGWVVEVDPYNPKSMPIKRTALGRYCREGATVTHAKDGTLAVYSGDDTRGEYIYKFVAAGKYNQKQPEANRHLLDQGTLYVAYLDDQGQGEWRALVWGENGLTPENGFPDQAYVLLNARLAADHVQATPMDRPEWVAIHPESKDVYVSLTNNKNRGKDDPLHPANPRANNLHGQILKIQEKDARPDATDFKWDLFLLAGEADSNDPSLGGNINGDIFSSPDGLAFDASGRLWIQTDYHDGAPQNSMMGCNQLLCADPGSKEVRRFLVGPRGCEITGITFSLDYRTLWVNVQHPGISYPASDGKSRPRSTTVIITKIDGGVIGT